MSQKRKIIKIDEEKCNGCKECIPNCPEGALQMIDGKARLVSDLFCDGLGACIGHCPQGAITIEEREAGPYDEKKVMENIVKQGKNVIKAHLKHLQDHGAHEYFKEAISLLKEKNIEPPFETSLEEDKTLPCGCPGTAVMDFGDEKKVSDKGASVKQISQLRQWPVQITLVPVSAPYLKNAHLLIAADCVPFAYADFHQDLLKEKVLLVGCPILDDLDAYKEKIKQIVKENNIKSIINAHMEVPCCYGLTKVIQSAIADSGKRIPFEDVTISIKGKRS